MLTKAHQALVDGAQVVDLAQVLLDRSPDQRELGADEWRPEPAVSSSGLFLDAVRDSLVAPFTVARHGPRRRRRRGGGAPTRPPGAS